MLGLNPLNRIGSRIARLEPKPAKDVFNQRESEKEISFASYIGLVYSDAYLSLSLWYLSVSTECPHTRISIRV
jgi:hypothetical protein